MIHNFKDTHCPSCLFKLSQAHEEIAVWYYGDIKPLFPDSHISWSYRGKDDQETFFKNGKTRLHYPNSSHNHTEHGKPCALALDLFQLDRTGKAIFDTDFYDHVYKEIVRLGSPIIWGGLWTTLGDKDHFQLNHLPKKGLEEG